MRGNRPAPRSVVLLTTGLFSILLLACIVPSYTNREPSVSAVPTQPPAPTSAPSTADTPSSSTIVVRISEEDANQWLENRQTTLGQGVNCRDMQLSIRQEGVWLSATVEVAQLQGAAVPVQVQVQPVVRDGHLQMDVLDIQLGGSFAPMSGLVKSLVGPELGGAFDADTLLAQEGMRVTDVALEDGFIVVTGVPAMP